MKKRMFAWLLAIVMLFGMTVPALAAGSDPEPAPAQNKTEVVIHKIVMTPEAMKAHDGNKKYDPRAGIKDIAGFFGEGTKTVEGVFFVALNVDENAAEITKAEAKDFSFLWNDGEQNKVADTVKEPFKGHSGFTNKDGQVSITLPDGHWKIYEVKELSTASDLKDSKAVPIDLTLPYRDNTGIISPLNVYPKNTEEKPKVDKDFENGFGGSTGANPDKPRSDKTDDANAAKVYVGQKVPYEVKTIIPAKTNNKLLRWTDVMSVGLTFNKDVKVYLNSEGTLLEEGKDYMITQDLSGFVLKFTEAGLARVNQKDTDQTIILKYSATVNEDAKVDTTIPNDVRFEYGNNPSEERQPSHETPKTTTVTAKKSWGEGAKPEDITFDLYKKVGNDWKYVGSKVLKKDASPAQVTWDNLEEGIYQVRERVNGFVVEWENNGNVVTATNNEGPGNPPPINPDEPKVVTGGKKFVKMKQGEDVRLAGAQFIIQNNRENDENKGKYLKAIGDVSALKTAFEEKQTAYEKKVAEYNAEAAKESPDQGKLGTLKTEVAKAKEDRDTAYQAYINQSYEWTTEKNQALVFTSDDQGRFEVKGLAYGKYKAVEIKAPEGYALPSNPETEFTVEKGSYGSGDVGYNPGESNNAQRINNIPSNIPQTGGIGTIIFTVAGLAIMTTAVLSLKRKRKEEM